MNTCPQRWSRFPVAKAKGLLCAAVYFPLYFLPPLHPFSLSSDMRCSASPTLQPRAPWLSLDSFLFLSLSFVLTFLLFSPRYSFILHPVVLLGRTRLSWFYFYESLVWNMLSGGTFQLSCPISLWWEMGDQILTINLWGFCWRCKTCWILQCTAIQPFSFLMFFCLASCN